MSYNVVAMRWRPVVCGTMPMLENSRVLRTDLSIIEVIN